MKMHRISPAPLTFLALLPFLALIMSIGCATLPEKEHHQSLEERVKNYMQAQVDGKWDRVYSFLDSSYRKTVSRESFINRPQKLSYKGFSIEEITILPSGDQATVKVRIDISFMGYDFNRAPRTQHWIKESGVWFITVESAQNPFVPSQK